MAGRAIRALKNSVLERMDGMVKSGLLERDDYGKGDYWIRDCSWSDYSGSTYTRSNARVLARDYAPVVEESWRGAHGWTGAFIPKSVLNDGPCVGFPDIAERVSYVLDLIEGLAEYPVLDEEDVSLLEEEILAEDWGSWGRRDVESKLNDDAGWPDVEVELDEDRGFEAFRRAAEGSGFTATGSDVRDHIGRAVEIYMEQRQDA